MLEQGLTLNKQVLAKLTSGIASHVTLCEEEKKKEKIIKSVFWGLFSNFGRIPLVVWS